LFRLEDDDAVFVIGRDGGGTPAGFLHFAVSRAGSALSLSSMPRLRTTPNGFNEWLVCESVAWAREHGFERLSLNFAPFAALLALASAAALNWGFLAQHGAAASLPRLTPRRPVRSLRLLFATRRWLAGFLVGIGGWALYTAALRLAPLSLVQAASAGGIGLLA